MKSNFIYSKLIPIVLSIVFLFGCFSNIVINASEEDVISNNCNEYNCYAYAIGRFEESAFYWYGEKPRYQPGNLYQNVHIYPTYNDVYTLANLVQNDLIALGHTNVLIYKSEGEDYKINDDENKQIDTYQQMLSSIDFETQELICARIVDSDEYHFMKYDFETNSWYSKYGYGSILKYTDNSGIPSNNVFWINGGYTYNSNIVYIIYDKLQINTLENGVANTTISVNGEDYQNSGKDVFYELIVPTTGCYSITLNSGQNGFNYEFYSYNMYNGDYQILFSDEDVVLAYENLVLTAKEDYETPSMINKYYLRADFGIDNTTEKYIVVSVIREHNYICSYESTSSTQHKAYCECGEYELQDHSFVNNVCTICGVAHTHDYTYDGEKISSFMHKAYCWCGEYITEGHTVVDGVCSLCGATHTHRFSYSWNSYTMHQKRCLCGYATTEPHVVSSNPIYDSDGYTTCLLCGGKVSNYLDNCSINQLPHTENGSYVTPSGIIVLVDEDIEAYLSGELIFLEPEGEAEIS